jgi:hypothetical protein
MSGRRRRCCSNWPRGMEVDSRAGVAFGTHLSSAGPAFGRRCLPAAGVAPSSSTPGILGRRAWPTGPRRHRCRDPNFEIGSRGNPLYAAGFCLEVRVIGSRCRIGVAGVVAAMFLSAAAACGKSSDGGPTGPSDPPPTTPFAGNWTGTALSNVSGLRLNIAVQLSQSGTTVSGPYTCTAGTGNCLIGTGSVAGTAQGNSLTASVTAPGGVVACSSFNGTLSGNSIAGTYGCTGGDTGTWSMSK